MRECGLSRARPSALVSVCLALSGCVLPAKVQYEEAGVARAMHYLANELTDQIGGQGQVYATTIVVDPMLDARTGQQTGASMFAEQHLSQALAFALQGAAIAPLDSQRAAQARYVISGSVQSAPEADRFVANIALSDRQTGMVVGHTTATFREQGLSQVPTRFYTDSPSLVRDRSVEGYLKTALTTAGNAADAVYLEQLPTSALLADAQRAYDASRWADALTLYGMAAQRPDGQQLRTYNGMYLCSMQLGRLDDAERAFGKIVELGLATNNLAVKLLFRPSTVDYWPDPRVSGVYPVWLRQIARGAEPRGDCLRVVGHTSNTGTVAVNDKLSLQRAAKIRDELARESPRLASKMHVTGVGSRENLVGSGTDDSADAVDRRVEFRVAPCY